MHREGERVEHRVRRARIARHHLAQLGHLAPALLEESSRRAGAGATAGAATDVVAEEVIGRKVLLLLTFDPRSGLERIVERRYFS
ncbi:MAG: hypothetical protein ACK56I_10170, partial [bacterium]